MAGACGSGHAGKERERPVGRLLLPSRRTRIVSSYPNPLISESSDSLANNSVSP
jgi:hypothetical protein